VSALHGAAPFDRHAPVATDALLTLRDAEPIFCGGSHVVALRVRVGLFPNRFRRIPFVVL
jgi:hypothetical protein